MIRGMNCCGVDDDILNALFGTGSQKPTTIIAGLLASAIKNQDLIKVALARGDAHVVASLADTTSEKIKDALVMFHQYTRDVGERN